MDVHFLILINLKYLLNKLKNLEIYTKEILFIKSSKLYSTTQDSVYADKSFTNLSEASSYIYNSSRALCKVLDSIIGTLNNNVISIKLPDTNDLKTISTYLNDIQLAISQVIINDDIGGELSVENWEDGSYWINLQLKSFAAVTIIASLAWSSAVVYKKIQEGRMFEEHVRSLNIKNDSLEDIRNAQGEALKLLILGEAKAIQDKNFENQNDQETLERLKLCIKTFSELIEKGAEIHPALSAPEEVSNLFPDLSKLEQIASKTKLITDTASQ